MRDFVRLFKTLDETTKTNEKLEALVRYFSQAAPADAAWAVYFLCGERLRRLVPTRLLRQWAAEVTEIPLWLLEEAYHAVGDLAETISLLVPPGEESNSQSLQEWVEQRLLPLGSMDDSQVEQSVKAIWRETQTETRFVIMKLITGAFRVGVSKRLVTRAIANKFDIPTDVVAHRLMGQWQPTAEFYERLTDPSFSAAAPSTPYPFCLAHPLSTDVGPEALGEAGDFIAEWKWDGIRCQLIRRSGETFIWSRGEELMADRWPEIERAAEKLPDGTVLDGELLAAKSDGSVLPFADLQRRIGRKRPTKKILSEVPVMLFAFDILEAEGKDLRQQPLSTRRRQLEQLFCDFPLDTIRLNHLLTESSWEERATLREGSRQKNAEGLMLKRLDSFYDVGRVRGTWWKWKIDPYTVDAVLIYAQKGHGKRASLFTDYTFAVWKDERLVPFAKAYSGLTDAEIRQVDQFVRNHTQDTFGPVRSVTPELVMELAFEGLQRSSRHKSGIATRFPRIVRWRKDKQPSDADSLDDLLQLLP